MQPCILEDPVAGFSEAGLDPSVSNPAAATGAQPGGPLHIRYRD